MPYVEPSEEAFFAADRRVVEMSDRWSQFGTASSRAVSGAPLTLSLTQPTVESTRTSSGLAASYDDKWGSR